MKRIVLTGGGTAGHVTPNMALVPKLIDEGYVDAENALTSEAFEGEGEGEDFMNGECPFVMAYWGAANTDTAYGNPNFDLEVIGFPSDMGQMPVLSITGLSVGEDAEHREDALEALDVMVSDEALQLYAETNKVISPSKNVNVECIEALKPLNDLVQGIIMIAGIGMVVVSILNGKECPT